MTLPEGYKIRRIEKKDYEGVVETLAVLTTVGNLTREQFESIVDYWNSVQMYHDKSIYKYNPSVIVDVNTDEVAAVGNIILEQKLIHEGGICGHIEDIAVSKNHQGKKLGKALLGYLSDLGFQSGCYKIILDCNEKNVKFYEKCGYSTTAIEMQKRK
ncbi:glucosamine 6-phosphate N-acetyltransferase NDAI_0G03270 [Naumovozyma dairenensis CBS 421]|uniref:Glucosamine 6-phosphate N-acetyltransferase n=1 Tax=Naumovozyma dairenensis (strain ATCC 10597 / BCRC 20456 / CBS 421 / NBRC 0211 / NRRL Y-12639) TaxID=1071378 RepID=G0WE93_NAUDC|nr:hypothetical protein NDAI_0G03270 [Naumovozyma dairenensis CBS 421]CCD26104.2 hypothetical protein NDAI_0G03270 [Naumovozyma dairenensis CBS 421]